MINDTVDVVRPKSVASEEFLRCPTTA